MGLELEIVSRATGAAFVSRRSCDDGSQKNNRLSDGASLTYGSESRFKTPLER